MVLKKAVFGNYTLLLFSAAFSSLNFSSQFVNYKITLEKKLLKLLLLTFFNRLLHLNVSRTFSNREFKPQMYWYQNFYLYLRNCIFLKVLQINALLVSFNNFDKSYFY